jgi:hypothetical protein
MNLFEQFRQAEETISTDQGQFYLFGLFERDDVPNKYDVVVSAAWLPGGRTSLMMIAELVRSAIGSDDWWPKIGKFVVLPSSSSFVKAVLGRVPDDGVLHDMKVLNDLPYDGEIIRNAVVITAQKHPVGNMAAVAS